MRRTREPRRATKWQVQLLGLIVMVLGGSIALADPPYLINGLRARYFGDFMLLAGACLVVAPSLFREAVAKSLDDGWTPVEPPPVAGRRVAFDGRFHGPSFLANQKPFPVRGDGRLTIGPAGIEVLGVREAERSMLILIPLVLLVAIILAATFLFVYARGWPWLALLVLIPVVAGPFTRKGGTEPETFAVPWESVHGFQADPTNRFAHILVTRTKPRGEIRFEPAGDVADVLDALHDRGSA